MCMACGAQAYHMCATGGEADLGVHPRARPAEPKGASKHAPSRIHIAKISNCWQWTPHAVCTLQDKRKIVLDDKLRTIFSGAVDMFSMNKQLSKHVWAAEREAGGQDKHTIQNFPM